LADSRAVFQIFKASKGILAGGLVVEPAVLRSIILGEKLEYTVYGDSFFRG
jgi:hypothetical protein